MASTKKLVTVFGATGSQGGSVVEVIVNHPTLSQQFALRAVTRDTTKPKAVDLKQKGVEVVSADMDDVESVKRAVKGSYAVFAVTNFWEHFSKEKEVKQGKNVADAAKVEGVQHLIWSALPNVAKETKGKYTNVDHFDGKADVAEYIRQLGIPHTFFYAAVYMSNFEYMGQTDAEGNYTLSLPLPSSVLVPFIDASRDTGKFVAGILIHREQTLGKDIYGAVGFYTFDELLDAIRKKNPNRKVTFHEASEEEYRNAMKAQNTPPQVISEMYEMWRWFVDGKYFGGENPEEHLKWSIEVLELMKDEKLRPITIEEFVKLSDKF